MSPGDFQKQLKRRSREAAASDREHELVLSADGYLYNGWARMKQRDVTRIVATLQACPITGAVLYFIFQLFG